MIRTRLRSRASIDRHGRLGRCTGFRVEDGAGRVGVVTGFALDAGGEPRGLVVHIGRARRRVVVPSADVVDIMPATRRVIVRAAPR